MNLTSEDAILARINTFFPEAACASNGAGQLASATQGILLGRGDDCAVLDVKQPLCISTDVFMEDVHFRRRYFSPYAIGWKSLAVNLSDLAACGATPTGFTVGLSLPPAADTDLVDGLCAGMAELANAARAPLLGGDLSRAERLHLCLTVLGETPAPLQRAVALPGDALFVIGPLGLARAGLQLLETEGPAALTIWPQLCAAHLTPHPRLTEGQLLSRLAAAWDSPAHTNADPAHKAGRSRRVRLGLMDVSDGLARDLPRLLGGFGATIQLPAPHPDLARLFSTQSESALQRHCFLGGEDFALLGSCPMERLPDLHALIPALHPLGTVEERPGLRLAGLPDLDAEAGFDHFS